MKYTVDGTDCHCCGHSAPDFASCSFKVWYQGFLTDTLADHDRSTTYVTGGSDDARDNFNIETFEYGATVDAHTVSHELVDLPYSGPGKATLVNLTVSSTGSGDFTSGLIFWPKEYDSTVPFDPRSVQIGFQFKYLTAYAWVRNALITGQQFYESVYVDADPDQPLPCTGIVVEYNGITYYNISPINIFNRCWNGGGSHSWGNMPYETYSVGNNVATLDGDGNRLLSSLPLWCLDVPSSSRMKSGTVTRIGFAFGLTSYDASFESLSLGNGTWSISSYIDRITSTACFTGRCNCYHSDLTTLQMTFNSGWNPVEFQGQTVTLTRVPGSGGPGSEGWKYKGQVNGTAIAAQDVQSLEHVPGGLTNNMLPDPNPAGWRCFVYASYANGDYGDLLEVDPVDGLTAEAVQDLLNELDGLDGSVTCSGGPILSTGTGKIIITSDSQRAMNCFHMGGYLTYANLDVIAYSGFGLTPRRVTPGNAGGARSADITLEISPSFSSYGTENITPRSLRSCCSLDIDLGYRSQRWGAATREGLNLPDLGLSTGPNHDPVYLSFWGAASPGSSCRTTAEKEDSNYWNGYTPKGPPPDQNSITEWGWHIEITE